MGWKPSICPTEDLFLTPAMIRGLLGCKRPNLCSWKVWMKQFLRILNKLNMESQRGRWHRPMGSSENLWGTESSNTTLSTSTKSEPVNLSIHLFNGKYLFTFCIYLRITRSRLDSYVPVNI